MNDAPISDGASPDDAISSATGTPAERAATPPVVHPLVRTHPETREKSLYLGMYCSHVDGMDEAEGRALVRDLQAHATSAPFVHAHAWKPGDLVFFAGEGHVGLYIGNGRFIHAPNLGAYGIAGCRAWYNRCGETLWCDLWCAHHARSRHASPHFR